MKHLIGIITLAFIGGIFWLNMPEPLIDMLWLDTNNDRPPADVQVVDQVDTIFQPWMLYLGLVAGAAVITAMFYYNGKDTAVLVGKVLSIGAVLLALIFFFGPENVQKTGENLGDGMVNLTDGKPNHVQAVSAVPLLDWQAQIAPVGEENANLIHIGLQMFCAASNGAQVTYHDVGKSTAYAKVWSESAESIEVQYLLGVRRAVMATAYATNNTC